jgi:hypothetical protein
MCHAGARRLGFVYKSNEYERKNRGKAGAWGLSPPLKKALVGVTHFSVGERRMWRKRGTSPITSI